MKFHEHHHFPTVKPSLSGGKNMENPHAAASHEAHAIALVRPQLLGHKGLQKDRALAVLHGGFVPDGLERLEHWWITGGWDHILSYI